MNLGLGSNMVNGLKISVDWLSFTCFEPCTVNDVISMMGYSIIDFEKLPQGRNGYRSQLLLRAYNISVQFDGQKEMGIHVDVSGSAIQDLLLHFQQLHSASTPFGGSAYESFNFDYTVFVDLLTEICNAGHVTRLDLAIDDIGGMYFSLPELHDIFFSGLYVSKFRKWKELAQYENCGSKSGHTIYMGSRSSAIMLRIYDKQLEENEKLKKSKKPLLTNAWIRWELELKEERAMQTVKLFMSGLSLADVSVGLLSNYLKIITADNNRKDRCSVSAVWLSFIADIKSLSLYRVSEPKTLDDTRNWLKKQVAPSLATVLQADGGALDFFYSLVESGSARLSSHQVNLINDALGGIL